MHPPLHAEVEHSKFLLAVLNFLPYVEYGPNADLLCNRCNRPNDIIVDCI